MALLFMDGFDAGDYLVKGWNPVIVNGAITAAPGRVSGGAILTDCSANNSNGSECRIERPFTAASQPTIGFALKIDTYGTLGNGAFYVNLAGDSGSTTHLTLTNNPTTRYIELRRGAYNGAVLATYNYVLPVGTWAYFEIQTTIADAGGICQVRMNGNATPVISFTGDTKNGGTNTTIDTLRLGSVNIDTGAAQSGVGAVYDDLYILNSTGTTNTTFLGDVRAVTLRPDGAGTDTQLTPTGSATNWQNVDETTYSTADYNASATVGQRDTYTLSNLPAGMGTIYAVQSNLIAAKSDMTTANARIPLRIGAGLYYGGTTALSTSYLTYSDVHQVNPDTTVSWTMADLNNLEAGMEVA